MYLVKRRENACSFSMLCSNINGTLPTSLRLRCVCQYKIWFVESVELFSKKIDDDSLVVVLYIIYIENILITILVLH